MNRFQAIGVTIRKNFTVRKVIGTLLGTILLGIGIAGLRLSLMGNDPYTAMNLALSGGFHMGLGNFQLLMNIIFFTMQFTWGYTNIGLGTLINFVGLGYIIQGSSWVLLRTIGDCTGCSLVYSLVYMLISLVVLCFGLGMYQETGCGVSPYDYLCIGLKDHTPIPFFICRIITDGGCVVVILLAVAVHFINWEGANLGIGTIISAFFMGPLIDLFRKVNARWINP